MSICGSLLEEVIRSVKLERLVEENSLGDGKCLVDLNINLGGVYEIIKNIWIRYIWF